LSGCAQYCRVHSLARAEGPTNIFALCESKHCGRMLGGPTKALASGGGAVCAATVDVTAIARSVSAAYLMSSLPGEQGAGTLN
jgi:hypothetical protein